MTHLTDFRWTRFGVAVVAVGAAVSLAVAGAQSAQAVATDPGLGTADSYEVLAGSQVFNTGPTTVTNGDVGLYPGSAVTGFPPGLVNNGVQHAADAQALQAQSDATNAFSVASGEPVDQTGFGDLSGLTLTTGVYVGNTLTLTNTLVLDGGGNTNAVFIFKTGSTLITSSGSQVQFINGANACHVYWVVPSSATIHTGSNFAGTVLALTSITAETGATITGRLFAQTGAVTLDTNTLIRPAGCAPRSAIVASTPTAAQTAATAAAARTAAQRSAAAVQAAATAAAARSAAELAATGTDPTAPGLVGGALLATGLLFFVIARRTRRRARHRTS
jgi:type VI secretion system secreted protein VgrG